MTFHKLVVLHCDCTGCEGCGRNDHGCLADYQHDRGRATEAREYAKRDGWVARGIDDYCGECAGYQ